MTIGKPHIYLQVLVTGLLFLAKPSFAVYSLKQPVHHQFNARLLQPGEVEMSLLSNIKVGVTPNLELGTNAYLQISSLYNLSVKHEMFQLGNVQTSFTTFSFFGKLGTNSYLIAPLGIVSTLAAFDSAVLFNFGIFDNFVWTEDAQHNASTEIHIIAPLLGVDVMFGKHWALSGFAFLPVFANLEAITDVAELTAQLHLYKGEKLGFPYPIVYFFGFSYSSDGGFLIPDLIELGYWELAGNAVPMLDLKWRIR